MRLGLFDSGLGGYLMADSILRDALYPIDIICLGDTAFAPYGERSTDVVAERTVKGVNYLAHQQNCDAVLIACNTALISLYETYGANAMNHIAESATITPIDLLKPTANFIADAPEQSSVCVLATPLTVSTRFYSRMLPEFDVTEIAAPDLVPYLEAGEVYKARQIFRDRYLPEILSHEPHQVLLGCTHYIAFNDIADVLLPPTIRFVRQGRLIAQIFGQQKDKRTGRFGIQGYVTGGIDDFRKALRGLNGLGGISLPLERIVL